MIIQVTKDFTVALKDVDQGEAMKAMTMKLAIDNPSESRRQIAAKTIEFFRGTEEEESVGIKVGMSTLETLVSNTRTTERGPWQQAIMMRPLLTMTSLPTSDNFLQFNLQQNIQQKDGTTKMSQMLGFGNPRLKWHCHQPNINLFFDGTFLLAPWPFKQLFTVTAYSRTHDEYFTVFYILLMSKLHIEYYLALQAFITHLDWKIDPATITGDFELGLIRACREQFNLNEAGDVIPYIGCLFHFVQANTRKAIKLGIDASFVYKQMWGKSDVGGVMQLLEEIPIEEIETKGK